MQAFWERQSVQAANSNQMQLYASDNDFAWLRAKAGIVHEPAANGRTRPLLTQAAARQSSDLQLLGCADQLPPTVLFNGQIESRSEFIRSTVKSLIRKAVREITRANDPQSNHRCGVA
jgi:hypothetical protein